MTKDNKLSNFTRELGFKLRMIRDYLGLNMAEASDKFEVSNGQVKAYESGRDNPNLKYMYDLTNSAGLSLDDLMLDKTELIKKLYFS